MSTKQIFLSFRYPKDRWILDSDCSRHMTRRIQMLSSIQNKSGGTIIFGDNNKEKLIGIDMIGNPNKFLIENVLFVVV